MNYFLLTYLLTYLLNEWMNEWSYEDTALAACWAAHQLQADRSDVQDSAVSKPAHPVVHQRTQHSIVVRPTTARAISTDIIHKTIVQHCRTSDLELTATCCVKLRLSLYFQIQT